MRRLFASLRVRLLLLVLLAFVPVLCATLYTNHNQRRQAVTEAQQSALHLAQLAAGEQKRLIDGTRQLLIALAQLPDVRNQNGPACSQFMAGLLAQYTLYENLGVANFDGDIFCGAVQSSVTANVADRPWFQRVLETHDFVAGDYILARITGRPTLSTAYPVLDGSGRVRGAVFAGIDLGWLDRFVAEARLPADSSLTVFDSGGTILTRYPDPEKWRGSSVPGPVLEAVLSQGEGVMERQGLDQVPRLYAFTALCCPPGGNVYVTVGIPRAVAFAEADRALSRDLILLGLVLLLGMAVAWGGAHFFVLRPIEALLGAIRRFEAGDSSARIGPADGGGELGRLARAFDQMAATVEAREAERDRSEAALRLHSIRAEALARVASRISAHSELESVLNLVCHETARALEVSAASVSLYDESLDTLRLVCHHGLPQDVSPGMEAPVWKAHAQQIKAGEAVVVPDVADCADLAAVPFVSDLRIRSFACTPMVHEAKLVGSLCLLAWEEAHEFTAEELSFLQAISDQAAQAIANARLYDALQREQSARAALLDKTISAQEEERKRIARELHDQTSQDLAALMLSLDTCGLSLASKGPKAAQHLQTAKSIAEATLTNIHRLINDLRPSVLDDLGLAPAILWYAERRLKPLGIAFSFECDRMEARLSPSLETALFRITQEALANIVKHAGATKVQVTLEVNSSRVHLSVEDDGAGFEMEARRSEEAEGHGLGLRGIRERALTLGGELLIQTTPGKGTTMEVEIPLVKEVSTGAEDPRTAGR